MQHTFAICAYKESPYLEECIESLMVQEMKSEIIICTSTPNDYIKNMAEKYNIKLYINTGKSGITEDWNFAYSKTTTKYVTIAHQDDVYLPLYSKTMSDMMEKAKNPIIFFTDYYELRNGKKVHNTGLLKIKRLMLAPLKIKIFQRSKFIRRRILSMGSPICCPSVTFNKERFREPLFKNHFRTNEDWECWEILSRHKGTFVYSSTPLTCHRIHEGSETSAAIAETGRSSEDYEMFRKFWPKFIAKLLVKQYGKSEKYNEL